jgi:hypothetical protein
VQGNGDPAPEFADLTVTIQDEFWDEEWKKSFLEATTARVKARVNPLHYQIFDFCVNKEWPVRKVAEEFRMKEAHVSVIKCRVSRVATDEGKRLKKEMLLEGQAFGT